MSKTIILPAKKAVPPNSVSIQAWDGSDFENSAYNNAIDDVAELLEAQGFEVVHADT